jgi:predicted aspartyl protease
MINWPRIIVAVCLAFLLASYSSALSQSASEGTDVERQSNKLATLLTKRGYVEVPLTLNKTGLLDVKVEVDGMPMLMVLDTGANNMNLDRASAKRAKLAVKEIEEKTSALGGTMPAGVTKITRLSVGDVKCPSETYVIDFSLINGRRKECGDPPCDGALGGSYLKYYSAVIDCASLKLYLLDPAQRAKKLTKTMKKWGHVEVPLKVNSNGDLDLSVEVNGTPMLLILDTGSTTTICLERSSAMRAKLTVKETESKGLGLGGGYVAGQTKIGQLSVGGLASAADAEVIDFSAPNATRKAHGAPPCDGNLGGPFLKRYAAVIDYAHPTLYLLKPARK